MAVVSVLAAVVDVPAYLLLSPKALMSAQAGDILIQVVFQGIVTSILAIDQFAESIDILGASRAVVALAFMPVSSMISAVPVLGEWPTPLERVALVVIVLGIVVGLGAAPLAKAAVGVPQKG